jgi:uncharacterized protein YjiS (DUF1127 family)
VRIRDIKAAFASAVRNHRRYRQVYGELMRLNDRELSELGISRYDVTQIAREAGQPKVRPGLTSFRRPAHDRHISEASVFSR